MKEREVATSCHFFLYYPGFSRLGLKYFGSQTFGKPNEMAGIDINIKSQQVK